MTGREVAKWIEEHGAEDAEIYVEIRGRLYKPSAEMYILGSEDCPCMDMVVIR